LLGKNLGLRIPAKTNPGTLMKMTGQGIQNTRQTGDLYVKLNAVLPEDIPEEIINVLTRHRGQ